MHGWIHFIDSKEDYEKLWNTIGKFRELYLGSFVIIDGTLTCKDGRIFGNKGEILVGITTLTFEKEQMKKIIESKLIDPSMTISIDDLALDELTKTNEGINIIKKVIKGFKKPSEFKSYLRKIGFNI